MDKNEIDHLHTRITSSSSLWQEKKKITLEDLYHIIRAVKRSTEHSKFLVIGSQAILGHLENKVSFDYSFTESMDIDIVPVIKFKGEVDTQILKRLQEEIFAAQGDASPFFFSFGYYADPCDLGTSHFPQRWEERLKMSIIEEVNVYFPSIEDIAYAKYVAFREKDKVYIEKLWTSNLIRCEKIKYLLECEPNENLEQEMADAVAMRIRNDINKYCS